MTEHNVQFTNIICSTIVKNRQNHKLKYQLQSKYDFSNQIRSGLLYASVSL